ncbi:MAG: HNH endonuclease [Solirubrobacteraceae bacterium]
MLREVPQARFVRRVTLLGRRCALYLDDRHGPVAVWGSRAFRRIEAVQDRTPVALVDDGPRRWWLYADRVWREDYDLDADDVRALVGDRQRRRRRRIAHAHASLAHDEAHDHRTRAAATDRRRGRTDGVHPPYGPPGEPTGRARRRSIPTEVRRAVWERDGGRCVACGTDFELQFDHVIPFAAGGGDTVENLQVLCGPCNRAKGATVG